ncbi:hypothetical protein [Streptomyces sp. PBH53]|uniref:hypothetical protein n=1 Tax=Streptomyces sp. PBH53 TaxID=1577075 RepID=UPI000A92159A|nr:hypothetical protein [Streptomyces sp. PBH53]
MVHRSTNTAQGARRCHEAGTSPRAEASAADSARSQALLFRTDAPQGLVEMFTGQDG